MIHVIVPMSGEAKRFAERGYTFPKPLIEIDGRPMIEIVVQNITPSDPHRFVFVCREDHITGFALADVLRLLSPSCDVVTVHSTPAGALCTVLLAAAHFDNDDELLICNGDQLVDASVDRFLAVARAAQADGCIMTFPSTHPKWSYVRLEGDVVVAVAEKRPISRHATAGIYYFRSGRDFLAGAQQMLLKNATVSGEFYVCPVYNELILMGKRITTFPIERGQMHSLGTPEDVDAFAQLAPSRAL